MSWLRIDDGFAEHPKIAKVSDSAWCLHMAAMCYSARRATDGVLDESSFSNFAGRWPNKRKLLGLVTELISAGLWDLGEHHGTYEVHDFLVYNPTKERRDELSEKRAAAGKKGGRPRQQRPLEGMR